MPVRKYSSVAEMPGVAPLAPLDPGNLRIACELTELAFGLRSWHLEPGVHKFGSVGEAFAARRKRDQRAHGGGAGEPVETDSASGMV